MPKQIEYQIGVNKKNGMIGIKFQEPIQELIMPADSALLLAKELIQRVKEIDEDRKMQKTLDQIVKEALQ